MEGTGANPALMGREVGITGNQMLSVVMLEDLAREVEGSEPAGNLQGLLAVGFIGVRGGKPGDAFLPVVCPSPPSGLGVPF